MKGRREIARTARRAVDVLVLLADRSATGLTTREISVLLHAPRTSVADLLKVLRSRHFVSPSPDGGAWRLDFRALQLANAYQHQFPLWDAARAAMGALANETQLPCQLAVLHRTEVVYIQRQDPTWRSDLRIVTDLGSRLPAHCTALGKAILAQLPDDEIDALYGGLASWPMRTKNSISSLGRLRDELRTIRRRGYALDLEEAFAGLVCAGAGILGADQRPEGAISLVGLRSQLSTTRLEALGAFVARAAVEISAVRGARALLSPSSGRRTNGANSRMPASAIRRPITRHARTTAPR